MSLPVVAASGLIARVAGLDGMAGYFIYFCLAPSLAALSSYVVLRRLGVARVGSAAASVTFALSPFATDRLGFVFLATAWLIPLVVYLLVAVATKSPASSLGIVSPG